MKLKKLLKYNAKIKKIVSHGNFLISSSYSFEFQAINLFWADVDTYLASRDESFNEAYLLL